MQLDCSLFLFFSVLKNKPFQAGGLERSRINLRRHVALLGLKMVVDVKWLSSTLI